MGLTPPKFHRYVSIVAGGTAVEAEASKLKIVVVVPVLGDTVNAAAGSAEPTLIS